MATLKKFLPLIITIVGAASTFFSPAVDAFYANHPSVVASIASVWAIAKWLLPSPIKNGQ